MLLRLLADGTLVLILIVAGPLIIYSLFKKGWIAVPVLLMAGLTSLLSAKVLSLLYQPAFARPFIELGVAPGAAYIDNPGFPSDHALLATATIVAVYAFTKNRTVTLFLMVLLLVMSIARVVALVHTPLDIVGGILAGLAGSLWYKKLTK